MALASFAAIGRAANRRQDSATASGGTAKTSVGVAKKARATSGRAACRRTVSASTALATRTLAAPSA